MTGPGVASQPVVVVVMGVSGCGKTTVGQLLAERLGVDFAEGDAFHPPANVAKMASGQPLDDDDRYPWLATVAAWIEARLRAGESAVVSCSALKRHYRDLIRDGDPAAGHPRVWFLHLAVDRDRIVERVARRQRHFMPASLVESQFQALEPLQPDEAGTVVDASAPIERIVAVSVQDLTEYRASTWPQDPSLFL